MKFRFPKVKISRRSYPKCLEPILPGLLSALVVISLIPTGLWTATDSLLSPLLYQLRGAQPWDSRLVLVGIDDATLKRLGAFPLDRSIYAQSIDQLTQADSSLVVLDLLLVDQTPEDAELAASLERSDRVVLPVAISPNLELIRPNPQLAAAATAVGHDAYWVEFDGRLQSIVSNVGSVPALSVASAQVYGLRREPLAIPPPDQKLWLNWPASTAQLPYFSLHQVVSGQVPPSELQNTVIIIGVTATGLDKTTLNPPFDQRSTVSSIYLQAVALDNILQNRWHRPIADGPLALILLTLGVSCAPLLRRFSWLQQTQFCIGGVLTWGGLAVGLMHMGYRLPVSPILALLGFSTISTLIAHILQSNAQIKAREKLLSDLSHEMRTPMNAVIGIAELLQQTSLSSHQHELTNMLGQSSELLLGLINNILDFAKLEAGKVHLESIPLDLADCFEQSLDLVAPRAATKGLELGYYLHPAVPQQIIGDPLRLKQIFNNLLSNSVKFTDQGQVTIEAYPMSAGDQLASAIAIDVKDTGIGIAGSELSKLFQPFSQIYSSQTAATGEGSGLGLSISKQLIEQMGGQLRVNSQVGRGSCFTLELPAPPAESALRPPQHLAGRRILIIDALDMRRQTLAHICQQAGGQTVAYSTLEAGSRQSELDAIVLDEGLLPEGDHLDFLLWPESTLVILLASPTRATPKSLIPRIRRLSKPVKRAVLLDAMKELWHLPVRSTIIDAPVSAFSPLSILVAEDNPVNQKVLLHLLKRLGHNADIAADGVAALDRMRDKSYDLVLMDMRMPTQDGLQTTKIVRQQPTVFGIPYIAALTANASAADEATCLAAGMDAYLSKPVRLGDLQGLLSKLSAEKPQKSSTPQERV